MKLVTRMTAVVAVAVLAFSASVAGAFSLRAPQVAFCSVQAIQRSHFAKRRSPGLAALTACPQQEENR